MVKITMKIATIITATAAAFLSFASCTMFQNQKAEGRSDQRSERLGLNATALDTMNCYVANPDGYLFTGRNHATLKFKIRDPHPDSLITLIAIRDTSLNKPARDTALVIKKRFKGSEGQFGLGLIEPGFYQIHIGKDHFNVGIRPEEIESPQDKQPDFDEFWKSTLDELARVPINARYEPLPEHSDSVRQCFKIEMNSFGDKTMGGILTIPVKPGKYPVSVEYMGYGAWPYYRDPSENPGRIDFLVSVRGQGIFRTPDYDWWCYEGMDSPQDYYYRGAFCDVVRAIDFVCSLEKADTSKIFAWGDSQGGAFTWVSAALDHRVRAIAPSVPFLGDYPDYAKIVNWPVGVIYRLGEKQGLSKEHLLRMLSYFDIKNLTDKVECPVYMAFGMQDPVCPPHTNFAGYNQCNAPKKYFCVPLCEHSMWREPIWQKERREFFEQFI